MISGEYQDGNHDVSPDNESENRRTTVMIFKLTLVLKEIRSWMKNRIWRKKILKCITPKPNLT